MSLEAEVLDGRADEARLWALERERRRVEAEMIELLGKVERNDAFRVDGHLSVRSWAMAITNWSPAETTDRLRVAQLLRTMPDLADALDSGELPIGHLNALGRHHRSRHLRRRSRPSLRGHTPTG